MAGPGLATRFPPSLPWRRRRQWRGRTIRHQHQLQLRHLETFGAPSKVASKVLRSVSCQLLLRCLCRVVESGKRQESIQHGWLLERLIVVGTKLAIEAVAKLAAGAEV